MFYLSVNPAILFIQIRLIMKNLKALLCSINYAIYTRMGRIKMS